VKLDTGVAVPSCVRMSSTEESPFRRDEPVSTSCTWIWLALGGSMSFAVLTLMHRAFHLRSASDLPSLVTAVAIQGGMVWLLFQAAAGTSHCRHSRSFETMAAALLAQRRFWIGLTFFAGLSLFGLLFLSTAIRDGNEDLRRRLRYRAPPTQFPFPNDFQ